MSMPVEHLVDQVLSLPAEARALLADRLVESLDPVEEEDLQQLWADEALRRLEEVRLGEVTTIPADMAIEQVRQAVSREY